MAIQGQYWQLFWIPNFGNLIQAIRFAETRVFPILWYYKLWWFKNPKTWFQTLFSFSVFFFGNQVFVGFFLVVGFAFFAWIPQNFFFLKESSALSLWFVAHRDCLRFWSFAMWLLLSVCKKLISTGNFKLLLPAFFRLPQECQDDLIYILIATRNERPHFKAKGFLL